MRYIYYIVFIILALSAALGYELLTSPVPAKDTAMIINGQVITTSEFKRICLSAPYKEQEKNNTINSLITRELLIQEAQREGIDKEESFRRSIQNFYEQSLIKLLMDKKFSSLKVSVSDTEIDRYISLLGSKLHVTVYTSDTSRNAQQGKYMSIQAKNINFDDLSGDIRARIIMLREGEKTGLVREDGKFVVMRLDKVEYSHRTAPSEKEKENIRNILINEKKERMISDWVAGLREKASVKIMLKSKN